jgi:hypothetical protein
MSGISRIFLERDIPPVNEVQHVEAKPTIPSLCSRFVLGVEHETGNS